MNIYQLIGTLRDTDLPKGVLAIATNGTNRTSIQMRSEDFIEAFADHEMRDHCEFYNRLFFDAMGVEVFTLIPKVQEAAA